MNCPPLDAGNTPLWKELLTDREDLSWAGASAGDRGFCFGTEDGAVFWTNFDGVQYGEPLINAAFDDYEEAVNGIAFNAGRMVVTTRSGSAVWKNAEGKASKRKAGRIGEGSHGVVAALNGAFFLPLNIGGLMSVYEETPSHYSTFVSNSQAMDLNVYRAISLTSPDGKQVVGIAARRGGVAAGFYKPGDVMGLTALVVPGADIIDICPTGNPKFPTAVFTLTRDSGILIFRDVVTDRDPVTVRYEGILGVAYRIISAGEFVFVLTSRALHVIHNLVDYRNSEFRVNRRTPSTSFKVEAVDMNIVGQRWLLLLTACGVLRLDLNELHEQLASRFAEEISEPEPSYLREKVIIKRHNLDASRSEFALVK